MHARSYLAGAVLCAALTAGAGAEVPADVPADVPAGEAEAARLQFDAAFKMLAAAEAARENGDPVLARDRYDTALHSYRLLAESYPDWEPEMVTFRLEYCANQLESLRTAVAVPPPAPAADTETADADEPALREATTNAVPPADAAPAGADAAPDPAPPTPAPPLDQLVADAERALREGEPETARQSLLRAFEQNPDDARVRLLAGIVQCQLRRFDDALYVLAELAGEQPQDARVQIALAAALFGSGQRQAARDALERALRLAPDLHEAHYNLAQLLMTGPGADPAAAARHYRRAIELGAAPDPRLADSIGTPEQAGDRP
jgi:tetratricopeptide (TPR) repeat protein